MAEEWDRQVLRTTGPHSRQAAEVAEIWAHIASEQKDYATATVRALDWARILQRLLSPDDPLLAAPVDNAHALWTRLGSTDARNLAGPLMELRRLQPGSGGRRLRDVQRRLQDLDAPGLALPSL